MGEDAPFWRFSAASYPDLREPVPVNALERTRNGSLTSEAETSAGVLISYLHLSFMQTVSHLLLFLDEIAL